MKLSDVINQAEEALRKIRNDLADRNTWGGPVPDPEGTRALMISSVTLRQSIDMFKKVTEL